MCPACIESAAVMVAGAASTGGVLALGTAKFRRLFRVIRWWRRWHVTKLRCGGAGTTSTRKKLDRRNESEPTLRAPHMPPSEPTISCGKADKDDKHPE